MFDCVEKLDDDIIFVGADDDFPVLDTLKTGAEFLEQNEDYVLAMGANVMLNRESQSHFKAKLLHARTIADSDPAVRIREFIAWPFATSYAATRREHYIDRCKNVKLNAMTIFGDYNVAFHDCLVGKIKSLPKIGYFTTKLPTHSRLEKPNKLHFLENAGDVLRLRDYYIDTLTSSLKLTEHDAAALANQMIGTKIAHFVDNAPHFKQGFGHSALFAEKTVQKQYQAFHDLFGEGNKTREALVPKLRFIVDSMQSIFEQNTDNLGEPTEYRSLEDMIKPINSPQDAHQTSNLTEAGEL